MTDGSAALKEYLLLLNRFGLSESEVIDLHWSGPVPDDATAGKVVAHVVDEDERTPEALYERLHRTLAASSTGIDAERSYDPDAPGEHLRTLLDPYNTTVVLQGPDGEQLTAEGPAEPFDVVLTDASGATRSTTFAYPEGPLGTNNLPALLHDVETELLADTGMTFVPLTEREDRWRVLLLNEGRLESLREAYGDRIEVFDRPLLHADSMAEFAEPEPVEPEEDADAPAWLADDGDASFEDVGFETADVEEEEPESETKAIDQEGIDDLFDSMEETTETVAADTGTETREEPDVADLVADDGADAAPATAEAGGDASDPEPADPAEGSEPAEPAESPEPAIAPGDNPDPATTEVAVTPGEDRSPAVSELTVSPGAAPEPAVTELAVVPGDDPAPATSPVAVTPGDEPEPAVEAAPTEPAEPSVVPGDDPEPAVTPVDVTPGEAPAEAVSTVEVTPGTDPDPAMAATPEAAGADEANDAVDAAEAATEAPEADDATADSADPAEPAESAPEPEEPAEAADEPAVTPTDGEPTPATRLTAEAEAERLVEEGETPPAASDASAEATDSVPADGEESPSGEETTAAEPAAGAPEEPAAPPEPRVVPGSDPDPAVRPAPAADETASADARSETSTAEATGDSPGVVGRLVGWLRGLF